MKNLPTTPLTTLIATACVTLAAGASPPQLPTPAIPAGIDTVAGFDEVLLDRPGDGKLWALGHGYKASFGDGQATYIPFLGSDAPRNYPITFTLGEVTLDGAPIEFDASAQAQADGTTVSLDRGPFTEIYELSLDSMEQKFTFPSLAAAGELRVRMNIDTELQLSDGPDGPGGQVRFEGAHGSVSYSSAVIVDSAGARIPVPTNREGQQIELRVEAAVLAQLAFPITIDPVIATLDLNAASVETMHPDVAYDETTRQFLTVWEYEYSAADHDIYARLWSTSGNYIGIAVIDTTQHDWRNPTVANNNKYDTFLIAAESGWSGERHIWGRVIGGQLDSPQLPLDDGGFGQRLSPSLGGDPSLEGQTFYCLTYTREYDAADHDVFAQLIEPDGGRWGGPIEIDNVAVSDDRAVRISRSNGRGNKASQRWNLVWSHVSSSTNYDVRGAQIAWDGTFATPPFTVDDSPYHDPAPAVSSPLDEDHAGERPYLVTFQRTSTGGFFGAEVVCTALVGSSEVARAGLGELGDHPVWTRISPAVDSDGGSFVVTYGEHSGDYTTADFDPYASTLVLNGNHLTALESHLRLTNNFDTVWGTRIATTYGSGGPHQRSMVVWTNQTQDLGELDARGAILDSPMPPPGSGYCTAQENSTGQPGLISASGSLSIAHADLTLEVTGLPANTPGLFYFGQTAISVPFGDGMRCVGGQTRRLYPFAHSDASGVTTRTVDFSAGYASSLSPGSVYWQLWYRDGAAGQSGFNLSNGLHTLLTP